MRSVVLAVAVALTIGACGQAGSERSHGGPGPQPGRVLVGQRDDGRAIRLRAGQHLVVQLPAGDRWKLFRYPAAMLRLVGGNAVGSRFDFTATRSGSGVIRALDLSRLSRFGDLGCNTGKLVTGRGAIPCGLKAQGPYLFSVRVTVR